MSLDVYLYSPGHTDACAADCDHELFSRNITHNLNAMADGAGLYAALWHPEELAINKACELIPLLRAGIARLVADPEHYRKWNASNDWGKYENLVAFVREYLAACEDSPEAMVRVCR